MTEGYTYDEIGSKVGRNYDWINVTITRLKRQNKCRSTVQLVAKILRNELLTEDPF
jgi:DNA-binding CsgD family transcriptional regulator